MAHPYQADLESYLSDRGVPFEVRRAQGGVGRIVVISSKPSNAGTSMAGVGSTARLRSSITEGVVVFLSLFDDNPAVHRAFCPPR